MEVSALRISSSSTATSWTACLVTLDLDPDLETDFFIVDFLDLDLDADFLALEGVLFLRDVFLLLVMLLEGVLFLEEDLLLFAMLLEGVLFLTDDFLVLVMLLEGVAFLTEDLLLLVMLLEGVLFLEEDLLVVTVVFFLEADLFTEDTRALDFEADFEEDLAVCFLALDFDFEADFLTDFLGVVAFLALDLVVTCFLEEDFLAGVLALETLFLGVDDLRVFLAEVLALFLEGVFALDLDAVFFLLETLVADFLTLETDLVADFLPEDLRTFLVIVFLTLLEEGVLFTETFFLEALRLAVRVAFFGI